MGFEYLDSEKLPLPGSGEMPIKKAKLLGCIWLLGRVWEGRAIGPCKPWLMDAFGSWEPFSYAC